MREILFRGKTAFGAWVHGDLIHRQVWKSKFEVIRIDDNGFDNYTEYEVATETIGQFTGLTDKNGTKIFEGDIVHILGNQDVEDWKNVDYNALIAFIDGGFCAIDGTIEEHGFRRYALARMDFGIEVIGNIHDNPELLENP